MGKWWVYFKNPVCTPLWSIPIKVVRCVAEFYHARNIRMGDTKWQHLLQTETGWASLLELKLTVSLRNLEFSEGKVSTDKLPRWDWIMCMSVRKAWFWTDIGGPSLSRWSWGKLEEYILVCESTSKKHPPLFHVLRKWVWCRKSASKFMTWVFFHWWIET